MNKIFYILPILFGLLTTTSDATLITQTWEADVSSVSNSSAYSVGDIFTWSITFDDAGTSMSSYNDGVNGFSNYGSDDDSLLSTFCRDGDLSASCDYFFPSKYTVMSESHIRFDHTVADLLSSSSLVSVDDVYGTNENWYAGSNNPLDVFMKSVNDFEFLLLREVLTEYINLVDIISKEKKISSI